MPGRLIFISQTATTWGVANVVMWFCAVAAVGSDLEPWVFHTLNGVSLKPFEDSSTRAIVLVFIATDCPIANAYHPRLTELEREYRAKGVPFFLIHSRAELTDAIARDHAREYDLTIPVVVDSQQVIARRIGAKVTPEAFILVKGQDEPVYRGRIDNLYAGYGKKRNVATTHDLKDALDCVLGGKTIANRVTRPVGCFISYETRSDDDKKNPSKGYRPLEVPKGDVTTLKLSVRDEKRDREIPVKVYLPKSGEPCPVILFSHGLGGTREGGKFLGEHWARRGYVCVFLQHPGSDDGVWKNERGFRGRMAAAKKAANGENFQLRAGDVPATIDQLEAWNKAVKHDLVGRMDLSRIGMAGHSFGAVTTQAVTGQVYLGTQRFRDERINAAIAMSPSPPRTGTAAKAFGSIEIPWFAMTGTKDVAAIGVADAESRLEVYRNLPDGNKFELVLGGGQHSAFSEKVRPRDGGKNPNHHRLILAYSTAFWDSFLKGEKEAKDWLTGERAKAMLEGEDGWKFK